ncbi:MAG: hypothetical protein QXR57_04065 [Metallosphaera sp.]
MSYQGNMRGVDKFCRPSGGLTLALEDCGAHKEPRFGKVDPFSLIN